MVYIITQYISQVEGKLFRVEAGKVIISIIIVFSSIYGAQYLSEQNQRERDSDLAVRILYIASNEVDDVNSYLLRLPSELKRAKSMNPEYTVEMLMNDNSIEIPGIVNSSLSDTNILRSIHPQSASALYVALSNSKSALKTLNSRNIATDNFQMLVNQASVFLSSLSEFMKYELMLQRGDVSEEEFFKMHREYNERYNKHTNSTAYKLNN